MLFGSGGGARPRRLASVGPTVLLAAPGQRHFRVSGNATLVTDNVVFQAAATGNSSGGVELDGPDAKGVFHATLFQDCRAAEERGGGLVLRNGAAASVQGGSAFLRNAAPRGGAVFVVGSGSVLTLGPNARIANNSAFEGIYAGSGVFLEGGTLVLDSNVTWSNNSGDDVATNNTDVHCADADYALSIDGGGNCSGAFWIPDGCPLCGPTFNTSGCSLCPKGSWGGQGAGLGCRLCPQGQMTATAGCTSPADCVPITDAPTASPTPTLFLPTSAPTERTSWGNFTNRPTSHPHTSAPSRRPTPSPTRRFRLRRFVRLNLTIGGGRRRRVRDLLGVWG